MYYIRIFSFTNGLGPEPIWFRDGSRTDATSKMGRFVVIVNVWKRSTIITKRSISDVAAALDPPLWLYEIFSSFTTYGLLMAH